MMYFCCEVGPPMSDVGGDTAAAVGGRIFLTALPGEDGEHCDSDAFARL